MEFADILPDECPPSSAQEIKSSLYVFRIVETNPPTIQDFQSQWALSPQKRPRWADLECKAKALSVFESRTKCDDMLKLPKFKGKIACKLNLLAGSGMILASGSRGHLSWWLAREFDPLKHCEVLI